MDEAEAGLATTGVIDPPRGTEIELFSEAVGAIYDCVLDPNGWTRALSCINELVGSPQAALYWGDMRTGLTIETHQVGLPPGMVKLMRNNMAWPLQINVLGWKVGEVHYLGDLLSPEEFKRGRFYREIAQPFQQLDYMAVTIVADGSRLANLSLATREQDGHFPPRSVELLKLVSPHLVRAAKMSATLDLRSVQASLLTASFDALSTSVMLVEVSGKVIYRNAAAEALSKETKAFTILDGRIQIADAATAETFFQTLIDLERPASLHSGAASLALPDSEGGLVATLVPIARHEKNLLGAPSSVTALFLQPMSTLPVMPSTALQSLYSFTHGETKVVMAMLTGLGVEDIADVLGVEEATVRSHLKRIFVKTGTTRQAELVQLLMRSMSPVRS